MSRPDLRHIRRVDPGVCASSARQPERDIHLLGEPDDREAADISSKSLNYWFKVSSSDLLHKFSARSLFWGGFLFRAGAEEQALHQRQHALVRNTTRSISPPSHQGIYICSIFLNAKSPLRCNLIFGSRYRYTWKRYNTKSLLCVVHSARRLNSEILCEDRHNAKIESTTTEERISSP